MVKPISISPELLDQVFEDSVKSYPNEACGIVLGNADRVATTVIACKNQQNDLHKKDPTRYPRTAATAYAMDPMDFKKAEDLAKAKGEKIIAIFHSHPDHGVYFSAEDKEMAAPWGEPLFPEISYLVVAVDKGEVTKASDFVWDGKDFAEANLFTT